MLNQQLFFSICAIIDFSAGKLFYESRSTSGIHRIYAKPVAVKPLVKRDTCQSWQYNFQGLCCDLCEPGFFAKPSGCTKDNHTTNCVRCAEGKEYMDKHNFKPACLRCNLCDAEHGLETEKNCTINQNVTCRCIPGFFCNSTKPCRHCDPCDTCENGIIEEKCTQTQNTKCGSKGRFHWLLIIPAAFSIFLIIILHKKSSLSKRLKMPENSAQTYSNPESSERKEREYPDIDLSTHIAWVASKMNLNQVTMLVRELGVLTAQIDEIKNANLNDLRELKIKLLEHWYQTNGIKGAYKTLITSLRQLALHVIADKIEERIEG